MSFIKYLLEANLYLVAFYALYYIIFRRETHYQLNRIYLLGSTVLAFIIPFIQVGILNPPASQLQDVVITTINSPIAGTPMKAVADSTWPLISYLLLAYGIISFFLFIDLTFKIYRLIRLSQINKTIYHETYKLIEIPGENNAFSFFNCLFISPQLKQSSTIINHELIHIRQKHSWDIIYLELLKVINWFNPVIWLMQGSMKEVHEFIADSQSVSGNSEGVDYTDFLINNAYGINQNTLTNTFFNQSLLKKRIMMLHQKRSGNAARLKYLFTLPLICGLLCASTLAFAKSYGWIDLAPRYNSHISVSVTNNVHKVYRLKFTSGKNSFITDKLSFKDNRGQLKVYTASSLTEKDKEYLSKTRNTKVEIVQVDEKFTKTDPEIKTTEGKLDDTASYDKRISVTSKGYKYHETGYLVNGKANFRVIITEKNGTQKDYYRNSSTTAQLAMLKDKYGYTFPKMDIFPKLPPPPPAPPAQKVNTPAPANPASKIPPPPPPVPPVKAGKAVAMSPLQKLDYPGKGVGNVMIGTTPDFFIPNVFKAKQPSKKC